MSWRCADCGRTYDRPPGRCSCGSAAVEPKDGDGAGRFSLGAVWRRLLAPGEADRSLVRGDSRVAVAFRVLVVGSLLVLLAALLLMVV